MGLASTEIEESRFTKELSVQPEWCRKLSLQQQSVLFLAARGPDGAAKFHPCKAVQRCYRACVLIAAKYGRQLRVGEKADNFMSLENFDDATWWKNVMNVFFDHQDELPHHFLMHLMHGAQILGYKHPDGVVRTRWHAFYQAMVRDRHLNIETEEEMDKRLGDWDREYW